MPFPVTSGGATSGDVISGVHTAPPQIGLELCPYTTFLKPSELQGGFVPLDSLLGLCPGPAGDLKRSADIFIGYSSGTIHLPGYLQSNKSLDGIYYLNWPEKGQQVKSPLFKSAPVKSAPCYIYKIKWKYRYLTLFFLPNATCLLEKQKYQCLQSLVWKDK